jgi:hypothetical protein
MQAAIGQVLPDQASSTVEIRGDRPPPTIVAASRPIEMPLKRTRALKNFAK